jgi:hypothetical protein
MQKACENVKAANIRLCTVRMIDDNANLLRNCATDPSMFYDIDEANERNKVSAPSRGNSPTSALPSDAGTGWGAVMPPSISV